MGVGETDGSRVAGNVNEEKVIFGELLWVKLKQATWWPAQVSNFANLPRLQYICDLLVSFVF